MVRRLRVIGTYSDFLYQYLKNVLTSMHHSGVVRQGFADAGALFAGAWTIFPSKEKNRKIKNIMLYNHIETENNQSILVRYSNERTSLNTCVRLSYQTLFKHQLSSQTGTRWTTCVVIHVMSFRNWGFNGLCPDCALCHFNLGNH